MSARAEAARRRKKVAPEPRRQPRSLLPLRLISVVVAVPLLLYAGFEMAQRQVESYQLQLGADRVRTEIRLEMQENLRLQKELAAARSDQQIEDQARRYLNLVRPGDKAIVLTGLPPTPGPTATPAPTEQASKTAQVSGWLGWLLNRPGP
jgi:cell division protein FtsB